MRQLLISELSKEEALACQEFLNKNAAAGGLAGLYWLLLEEAQLGPAQQGHASCGPFSMAIELGDDFVAFELLIRSRNNLHCSCTGYATEAQRDLLLRFADKLVMEAGLRA